MRPVERGNAPQTYTHYQDAGPDLQARIGDYCSYCERQIETNLAVEHIQPKSHVPTLVTEWSNFLLGCVNCNSSKGDTPVNPADHLWPDTDNTLLAFQYTHGGLVNPHVALSARLATKAQATITLAGLDKYPGNHGKEPSAKDKRWLRRQQVWQLAEMNRTRLLTNDSPAVRELIVENAVARGMFSIWWTVFAGDTDMRRRFREAFTGTHGGCFDANEDLVARVGGQV